MNRNRLALGLPLFCAAAVSVLVLVSYAAGPLQEETAASGMVADRFIAVDCSEARGARGKDFSVHDGDGSCRMSWTIFRRLYPEVAQHVDESTWQ
jgi:hypothetical protein